MKIKIIFLIFLIHILTLKFCFSKENEKDIKPKKIEDKYHIIDSSYFYKELPLMIGSGLVSVSAGIVIASFVHFIYFDKNKWFDSSDCPICDTKPKKYGIFDSKKTIFVYYSITSSFLTIGMTLTGLALKNLNIKESFNLLIWITGGILFGLASSALLAVAVNSTSGKVASYFVPIIGGLIGYTIDIYYMELVREKNLESQTRNSLLTNNDKTNIGVKNNTRNSRNNIGIPLTLGLFPVKNGFGLALSTRW